MAKHRELLPPRFPVGDSIFVHRVFLEPLWRLIGAFGNRYCRSADQLEILVSFERHGELIARRFDESIVSEHGTFLRAMVQSEW
jgi:hypothetical protein